MDKIYIIVMAVGAVIVAGGAYKFFGLDKIQNWLLWAVSVAEKEFGSGTGKLKLIYVYNMFIEKFPKLQAIVPYKVFATLVDKALESMRAMLQNNKIDEIINNK